MKLFYIEVTDTFGGEANYSWVTRHILRANTVRGAINRFAKMSGMHWRGVGCDRYDSESGATCFFIEEYESIGYEPCLTTNDTDERE